MNVQALFQAIKDDPMQHTLIVAVAELERQGYAVTVDRKHRGLEAVVKAVDEGRWDQEHGVDVGVPFEIGKGDERQAFRLHFLDLDAIALTALESPPVIYHSKFTIDEFQLGDLK